MKVAINRQVVNKSKDWEILAIGFNNVDLTQAQLASEINQGYAFTTHHEGRRRQENFKAGGYVALDIDRGSQAEMEEILADPLVSKYHGIFYHTYNSRPEQPRFRLVFELEHPVYDADYYRQINLAFIWKFGANADENCKDPCRLFYGSKGSEPAFTNNLLTMPVVSTVIKEYRVFLDLERQANEATERERRRAAIPSGSNKGKKAFLDKVLDTHCENVRHAQKGECHNTLLNAAQVMGGYLAGELDTADEYEIRRRLEEAYQTHSWFNRKEMKDAIDDGFAYGQAKPLFIPDRMPSKDFQEAKEETKAEQSKQKVDQASSEIADDLFLADFSADDDGNAEAFRAIYGQAFLFCKAYGWLWWSGTHWKMDLAEQNLYEKMTEVLKRRRVAGVQAEKEAVIKCAKPNSSTINNAISLLEKKLEVLVEAFDRLPNHVNCQNGVLNLQNGELDQHDPQQRFTYCIPIAYHSKAQSETWDNFIKGVVGGGQAVLDYLQQALGYTLTGQTNEECLFYLYGPTRSGKGTLTEILMALMSRPLSAEADFNTFTARRDGDSNNFDLAPLKPARAVFASESERYQRLNPAKIKQLTGGNYVYCSFKHRDHFNYRPQYKLWLSSNWPVNGDVDDDALWGRVRVIDFPNSFLGREDKLLKLKLKQPEHLQAAFVWMVQGAIKWYHAPNGLETPAEVNMATTRQREEADAVQSWLDENCEQDLTAWESNAEVYSNYERWCKSNGVEAKQMKSLSASLKAKGYSIGVVNRRHGATARGITGLKIIPRI
jgi:P4 family phage/plasmid primase-like protien